MADKSTPPKDTARLISLQNLADRLSVSHKTVRRMHNAHRLPDPIRLPGSNLLRWRLKDIEQWLDTLGAAQ